MNIKVTTISICLTLAQFSCVTSSSKQKSYAADSSYVQNTSGYMVLGKYDRAAWIKIRSKGSDAMKLYSSLGTKEWDIAINDARASLQRRPKNLPGLYVMATALAMKHNYHLASYYAKLLDKYHPGVVDTKNIKALAILNQSNSRFGDYQKAISLLELSIEERPAEIASALNLGHLHMEMGRMEAARDIFRLASERCKQCTAALFGLGISSLKLRDINTAKESMQTIVDNDPQYLPAKYHLALIVGQKENDKKKAIKMLAAIIDHPSNSNDEIKRQSNFVMRRWEARIYVEKRDLPSHNEEGIDVIAENREIEKEEPNGEGPETVEIENVDLDLSDIPIQ